jgi:D-alanine-D-alanine ligase
MVLKDKNLSHFGRIGILMGGPSTEREISLKSGKTVYESLGNQGLDVVAIDIESDDPKININKIISAKLDVSFIALHGRFGEDGGIQEILEDLNLPYTGSGILASKLALDKVSSRRIFQIYNLAVPRYKEISRLSLKRDYRLQNDFGFPWVIKPASHGSSIGLSIIEQQSLLNEAIDFAFRFDERIIIEEYLKGREITVGILDDRPLPIIEIIPKNQFFDFEAKYKPGMTEYVVPADLDKKIVSVVQDAALCAYRSLGCFGFSRVDMILKDDTPYILEVNTIPGLTQTSLLPKAAAAVGINFVELCIKLLELAFRRSRQTTEQSNNCYEKKKDKITV